MRKKEMMDLNQAYYLVHVVEKQGFSAAARTLGIPKSRISRQVKTLEEVLGTRLLNRDSRHMSLTEAGEAYYRHAKMALDCMAAAEAAVRQDTDVLKGSLLKASKKWQTGFRNLSEPQVWNRPHLWDILWEPWLLWSVQLVFQKM